MYVQMKVNSANVYAYFDFCIADKITNIMDSYVRIVESGSPSLTDIKTFDCDITNITGEKYIYLMFTAPYSTSLDLDIYKIWLEK